MSQPGARASGAGPRHADVRPGDTSDARAGVVPAATLAAVDRLAASPPILVVTDFDGTLSPIVPEPPAARILPAARRALRRLAALANRGDPPVMLAVLSGRDAADVARRVGVAGPRYLGQHGIEEARLSRDPPGAAPIERPMDPDLVAGGRRLEAIAGRAARALGDPEWLVLERKRASMGLHYRRAADPEAARQRLLEALREALRVDPEAVQVMESRRVVELRPSAAHGKGEATEGLLAATDPGAVLVLGDDRTDAASFDAVERWRTATGRPALRVGVSGARETPPEIEAASDVLVADPAAAAAVLARLADALEQGSRGDAEKRV